ncbi:CPBP family intramembrane glutamic endopeptidase [Ornithinibacillus halotolerans]|uniref:CAAX amino protease n=1 Tax=Ornithinibacillus halotolerans TaxID=1274357 RepID=A0A916W2S7_9BACI|nr:CPBP family intramembrane glutamic endopeptidase [Ornithinibacillus halotolerans]GGA62058.1 CAAX amino protease [Ornithinibacillus halotolerans]
MRRQSVFIITSTLITCGILAFVEHGLEINYLIKTTLKVTIFFLTIWWYQRSFNKFRFKDPVSLEKISRKEWRRIFLLGFLSATIVFIAYVICLPFIDLSAIKGDLTERLGITTTTYIIVGLYITFGNSFLEEYFFRGFIFFQLPRKLGYIYSPLLFASYHIPMIILWFSPTIIGLCFIGLWIIGLIFHKVNEKNQTIWASWMIHICADIVIVLIGLTLFY